MTVVGLSWYICCVLAVAAVFACAITVAPEAQSAVAIIMGLFALASAAFGFLAASLSRLPEEHWVRSSRSIWNLLVAFAVLATVMLVMVG